MGSMFYGRSDARYIGHGRFKATQGDLMKNWLYKYGFSPSGGISSSYLDEQGLEGWELVVIRKTGNVFEHLFKKSADIPQWEYMAKTSPSGGTMNIFDLGELSRHGWELTTIVKAGNIEWHVFKRELGLYDLS